MERYEIVDILIGEHTVLVKTTEENFEFKISGNRLEYEDGDKEDIPDVIISELEKREFLVEEFPTQEVDVYFHDEGSSHDYREIAKRVDCLNKDSPAVRKMGDIGYEIRLTFRVEDESTVYLIGVNGNDLKEEQSL